jgi:predicted metal-binding protein
MDTEADACPWCHCRLQRSLNLVPKHTVLGCRPCRAFRLEGDERWVSGGSDMIGTLTRIAKELDDAKRVPETPFDWVRVEWA